MHHVEYKSLSGTLNSTGLQLHAQLHTHIELASEYVHAGAAVAQGTFKDE